MGSCFDFLFFWFKVPALGWRGRDLPEIVFEVIAVFSEWWEFLGTGIEGIRIGRWEGGGG